MSNAYDKIAAGLTEALAIASGAAEPAKIHTLKRQPHGCNVSTCPNGKCHATGECIDRPAR